MKKTLMDFIKEAKSQITEIKVNEASNLLLQGYKILDVREPEEFSSEHIQESINVPRGVLEATVDFANKKGNKELQNGRDGKWLVLCKTSGRSAMATVVMQQMGFIDVKNIEGGINSWIAADLPTIKQQ